MTLLGRIYLHAKIGYKVRKKDPLFTIYSTSEAKLDAAIKLVELYNPIVVEGMLIKALP